MKSPFLYHSNRDAVIKTCLVVLIPTVVGSWHVLAGLPYFSFGYTFAIMCSGIVLWSIMNLNNRLYFVESYGVDKWKGYRRLFVALIILCLIVVMLILYQDNIVAKMLQNR